MLSLLQVLLSLTTTLPALRLVRGLLKPGPQPRSWFTRLVRLSLAYALASVVTLVQLGLTLYAVGAIVVAAYLILHPEMKSSFDAQKFFKSKDPSNQMWGGIIQLISIFLTVLLDRPFLGSFGE